MAIFNVGSINVDWTYSVPRFPLDGETLSADSCTRDLGGKGANQSVAAVRAGATVYHIGAIGEDGAWARDRLVAADVDVTHVSVVKDRPTGHALIFLTPDGENRIVINGGSNGTLDPGFIAMALERVTSRDTVILQNETNAQLAAARHARDKGARVVYSAAPFSMSAVEEILPFVDLLIVNEIEAEQLSKVLNKSLKDLGIPELLVTKGSEGAIWFNIMDGDQIAVTAPSVQPVNTTGAGDTLAGYFCAARDMGAGIGEALELAVTAATLKVTRPGTFSGIPVMAEVKDWQQGTVRND